MKPLPTRLLLVMPSGRSLAQTLGAVGFLLAFAVAELATVAEAAGAESADAGTAPLFVDHREVIVPVGSGERIRIDNPLGHVVVRARPEVHEIHIVADKRAMSDEQLHRLRVHYLAWASGEISIDTRVDLGGRERSLPLSGSRIDLEVDVPAGLEVEAKTFGGNLTVSGLRAGARLETTAGRIDVSDVRGTVITHQLRGEQQVAAVEGDVELDGVEGSMDLQGLGGGHLDARMVDGTIRAEDIRSDGVRLLTTAGDIVFIGLLRPSRRYELRTYDGNVVFFPGERPRPFELRARSAAALASSLPLRVLARDGTQVRAVVDAPSLRERAFPVALGMRRLGRDDPSADRPIVELASTLGRVMIVAARSELPLRP